MKVLLFLAKGFETMEASAFIDVIGWAGESFRNDVEVVTCGFKEFEVFPTLWDEDNPCQIYVMALK